MSHVLRIACPDRTGLIHKITGVLFAKGLNITDQAEFVDGVTNTFLMRTEFSGAATTDEVLQQLRALVPEASLLTITERRKKRIVIFGTRETHCMGDLLLRHAYNSLNAEVLHVFANHEELRDLSSRFHLPFTCIEAEGLSREEHEKRLLTLLGRMDVEYIVLAKYMRILNPSFVAHYPGRIINIHHSFLPAFIGSNPYQQAYDRGVKIIGATAHFVNENLDEGPIITQDVTAVDHTHDSQDMARAGHNVEKIVLARALDLVFDDRVIVHGKRTIVF